MGIEHVKTYLLSNLKINSVNGDDLRLQNCLVCGRARTMKVSLTKFKFFCLHRDCNSGGNLTRLIELIENCDPSSARDIRSALLAGMSRPTKSLEEIAEELREMDEIEKETEPEVEPLKLPGAFVPCWKEGRGWRIPKYLVDRGVSRASLRRWGIGFCELGDYAGRVVVPIRTEGTPGGFVARKMSAELRGPTYKAADDINTGDLLFGYDELQPDEEIVAAMEGVFDSTRWWEHEIPSVSYLKDRLSTSQVSLLLKKGVKTLILVPDGADRKAVARAMRDAARYRSRFDDVRVAIQEDGRDPDQLNRDEAWRLLRSARRLGELDALEYTLANAL